MRRTLAVAALLAAAGFAAPATAAPDPIVVPLCDLEGHCDRRCYVYFTGQAPRCGV